MLPVLSLALRRAESEFEALSAQGKAALAGSLQAVVVVPSRELAMQITRVGQSLLPAQARGCVQQAIGGANINRQVCDPACFSGLLHHCSCRPFEMVSTPPLQRLEMGIGTHLPVGKWKAPKQWPGPHCCLWGLMLMCK